MAGFEYTEYFTKENVNIEFDIPIVRAQNVRMGRFVENQSEAIKIELSELLNRSSLTIPCLLMTFIGAGVGDTCIFPALKRNHLAPNVAKMEPYFNKLNLDYFLQVCMSSCGQEEVNKIKKSTAQPSLSMATIRSIRVPMPPIQEQIRIANATNYWLGVVDRIEYNKKDISNTIEQVKNKILSLAITGKLVKQIPSDEPAIELLKRINPTIQIPCDNPHYQKLPQGWSMCRLEDVVDYEQPQAYIVDSTDYSDNYGTPVLTAGKTFVIGYTNENHGICDNLPVIIFDDFTTDSKFVDFPFKVKSSAMKILRPRKGINIKFLAYYMSITRLVGKTHKRYWISEYSKLFIPIPPYNEQNRIVNALQKRLGVLDDIAAML